MYVLNLGRYTASEILLPQILPSIGQMGVGYNKVIQEGCGKKFSLPTITMMKLYSIYNILCTGTFLLVFYSIIIKHLVDYYYITQHIKYLHIHSDHFLPDHDTHMQYINYFLIKQAVACACHQNKSNMQFATTSELDMCYAFTYLKYKETNSSYTILLCHA